MKLTFQIDFEKQKLERTDGVEPVAESMEFLEAEFTFSGLPEGFTVTPLFAREESTTPQFIQEGNLVKCFVPHEVIQYTFFTASAFAYNVSTGTRITLPKVIIPVVQSGYHGGVAEPSKSVYEQILDELKDIKSIAEGVNSDEYREAIAKKVYEDFGIIPIFVLGGE